MVDTCLHSIDEQPPYKVGDFGYTGYIVYSNGYFQIADYMVEDEDNVPYFYVNGEYDPNVTHWACLPEPPEGVK